MGCRAAWPGVVSGMIWAVTESLPPEDRRDALIRELAAQVVGADGAGGGAAGAAGGGQEGRVEELGELLAAAERRRPARAEAAAEGAAGGGTGGEEEEPGEAARFGGRGDANWREPDETLDHYPQGACACGLDLAGAADLGVARSYQQEDVPEPQPSRRYQHDLHKTRCACGKVHVAPRPDGVPDAPLSVGPRLSAVAVYLTVFQHVPVERAQRLIADLTGGVVSAGFVHSCLARAAGLVKDPVALVRVLIAASPVAGFDETTLRSGPAGEKKYVHGAFTELYSAFHLGTRSIESMKKGGILPFFAGIVVSDRYQGYWSETWTAFAGAPGLRGPPDQGLRGLRRDLSRLRLAAAGPKGAARPDPRLARRPRAGPARRPGRDPAAP